MASKRKSKDISTVLLAFKEALISKNVAQLILLLGNKDNHYLVNHTFSLKNEPLVQANICHLKNFSLERFTPLCLAILYNDLQLIELLLEKGATQCGVSRATDQHGPVVIRYTPLHLACEVGDIQVIERLLNAGFDVDQEVLGIQQREEEGGSMTCREYPSTLFFAMSDRNLEVMETLLKHGASVEIVDGLSGTPLHVVCEEISLPHIHLIVRYGAMKSDIDYGGFSPLFIFCNYISIEFIHLGGEELLNEILTSAFLLFVASGYDLTKDYWYVAHFRTFCSSTMFEEEEIEYQNERRLWPKLRSLLCGYCSLKNLCRRVIRQQLYHNRKIRMPMSVDYLPLPTVLKDYVSLKEPVID